MELGVSENVLCKEKQTYAILNEPKAYYQQQYKKHSRTIFNIMFTNNDSFYLRAAITNKRLTLVSAKIEREIRGLFGLINIHIITFKITY